MKTRALLVSVLLMGIAASAQAATIVGSKHDLSTSNASATSIHAAAGGQNQTCVFCHTPHNAVTNKLLWNRNYIAGTTMKIYTSYNTQTLRTAFTMNTLTDDSSSLLCLSCHSLAAVTNAAGIFSNTANAAGGAGTIPAVNNFDMSGGATGPRSSFLAAAGNTMLTNTHPVGIDYGTAITNVATGSLNSAASVTGAGLLPLFKSSQGTAVMECGTCHAVHDPTVKFFLRKSNNGSALCTTCHAK